MVGAHGDGRDEQEEVDYSDEEDYQDYLRAEEERRWQDMDFYGILELSPSASPEEIRKGFRRVALARHPDKAGAEDREEATRNFQLLAEAYEVLSREQTRQRYDRVKAAEQERLRAADEKRERLRAEAEREKTCGYRFISPTAYYVLPTTSSVLIITCYPILIDEYYYL